MSQESVLASLGYMWHDPPSGTSAVVYVPPLCTVPAGPFLMGSDPQRDAHAHADEQPAHVVTLPTFHIAQYPVTVAEYETALEAGAPGVQAQSIGRASVRALSVRSPGSPGMTRWPTPAGLLR